MLVFFHLTSDKRLFRTSSSSQRTKASAKADAFLCSRMQNRLLFGRCRRETFHNSIIFPLMDKIFRRNWPVLPGKCALCPGKDQLEIQFLPRPQQITNFQLSIFRIEPGRRCNLRSLCIRHLCLYGHVLVGIKK